MRRTKEWWAKLTKEERSQLVFLEKANNKMGGSSAYLPDDCRECPSCSAPSLSSGLCPVCASALDFLLSKAGG